MDTVEDKLSALLQNPQLMQQVMALAQSLGDGGGPQNVPAPRPQSQNQSQNQNQAQSQQSQPGLDPALLKGLSSLMGRGKADSSQQALLRSLTPYLSRERISKLERAMRAARIAQAASAFLNSGGLQLLTGR